MMKATVISELDLAEWGWEDELKNLYE